MPALPWGQYCDVLRRALPYNSADEAILKMQADLRARGLAILAAQINPPGTRSGREQIYQLHNASRRHFETTRWQVNDGGRGKRYQKKGQGYRFVLIDEHHTSPMSSRQYKTIMRWALKAFVAIYGEIHHIVQQFQAMRGRAPTPALEAYARSFTVNGTRLGEDAQSLADELNSLSG